jgi:DNA-binding response OmpR family regulator
LELGKPVSSNELIETIWGKERYVLSTMRELYVVIHRLRAKMGGKETEGSHIISISGYGYMLSPIDNKE